MKKLTHREEQIMQILWRLDKAFAKEIHEGFPEPKPHINTISTVIRRLVGHGYIAYEDFGTTHRYYPKVSKKVYTKEFLSEKMAQYFDSSVKGMITFFAKEEKVSVEDLKDIIRMIEEEDE